MNTKVKNIKTMLSSLPYISKAIIFGGIVISTIMFAAAFIAAGNGTDWIDVQSASSVRKLLVEYYLLCVVESLGLGFFAHYLLSRS